MTDIGASSIAGPRPQNEDGFLTIDLAAHADRLGGLRALLVVADGMGGHAHGELASRCAVEASQQYIEGMVAQALSGHQLELDPHHLLWDMIGAANAAVIKASREQSAGGMGSTIVAALVGQDRAWVAHVGDSRAYHLRPNETKRVTTDHSMVGRLVAQGVITESEALAHPQRNVVERALGFEGALPDFGKVWLEPADALMLASDGLFTALEPGQILAAAVSGETVIEAAARLTEAAAQAGTDDNATVVIWAGDWAAFRAAHGAGALELLSPALAPQPTLEALASAPERPSNAKQNRRAWYISGAVLVAGLIVTLALVFAATRDGAAGGGSPASVVTATLTSSTEYRGVREMKVVDGGGYIRKEPGNGGKILGTLSEGTPLQVVPVGDGSEWWRVTVDYLRLLMPEAFKVGSLDLLVAGNIQEVFISSRVLEPKTGE